MLVNHPIGETFNFFGLDLAVDDVKIADCSLFRPQEITIKAYKIKTNASVNPFGIDRVIFNGPATIVFWTDGTKTVVKCAEGETYDKKTSILWAYAKKICGTSSRMNKVLDKLVEE